MKLTSKDTLRAVMTQKGFSGARLARYAGCSSGFISQLGRGVKTTCSPQLAENIAEALGVDRDLLFVERLPSAPGRTAQQSRAA
jgi:transcriptional regulator with XRE-family HTH domain